MSRNQQPIVLRIPPDDIVIPDSRREVDVAAVEKLAGSLKAIGLRTPITVRFVSDFLDPDTGEPENAYILVTGRHRLEAVKSLGWEYIHAIDREGAEEEAEMWEISENLHRAELNPLERGEHVKRWIELEKLKRERVSRQPDAKPDERPSPGRSQSRRARFGYGRGCGAPCRTGGYRAAKELAKEVGLIRTKRRFSQQKTPAALRLK